MENEKNPEFIVAIWLIILFLLFSFFNTLFINKFVPKENIDLKIIFGGISTLIIETLTVYILFQKYREYFQSI
ncbi:hypothetical protein J7L87_03390, partial [bacterium]|nr:hypothetical protein [bacterium]